jgi:GldM C-terminal domain/BlaR1 peptidase M56/Gram-negative bacterial TonB protein C-terminal
MTAFAEYLLKVMICSGVLTGYYWLALRNKLFHSWNRFYLLAAVVTSLLLPFIKISFITEPQPENLPAYTILQSVTTNEVWFPDQTTVATETFTKEQASILLYMLVSIALFITLLVTLLRIKKLLTAYEHWKMKDLTFVDTDAKGTPFSFLHYIFWNREIDFESAQGQQIFKHELIHVKEKHSVDKLFLQLVLIVFWINPFFWIIRKELTMIHEFIADRKSVKDSDASALAAMILTAAFPGHTLSLTNPFFYSPIKRRLLMLSKLQNPKVGYISRLLLLPLLTVLFTAFALKIKKNDAASSIPLSEKSLSVEIPTGDGLKTTIDLSVKQSNSTDTIPEKKSEVSLSKTESNADFKGGIKEWNKYVETFLEPHISTLEKDSRSVNNGCMLQFTVQKDGSITDIQVITNTESELAKISVELLKNSPKWQPALENGAPVATIVKRSVHFFDKYGRARMKDATKTSEQKEKGLTAIAEKHGLHILNGKAVSKEEMIQFIKDNKEHKNWNILSMDGGGGRLRFGEKGSNGVFELTTTEVKPTIAVAAENINILYASVENPLKIAISDVPETHLEIETSQGTLEKKENRYILKNLKTGEVVIKIGYYYKTDQKKIEEVRFKVVQAPDPSVTIAESRGGRIAANKILQAKQLTIDEDWEIANYTMYFTGKGFDNPYFIAANKSPEFNQRVLEAIAKCQPGTTIVIDEIIIKRGNTKKPMPPLAFNLY